MEHFFPRILVKTKKKKGLHQNGTLFFPKFRSKPTKKKVSTKHGTFFPRIQVDTYAQLHIRVKLLRGKQDVDHTQTIGGDTVKLLGDISPIPRVSAPMDIDM